MQAFAAEEVALRGASVRGWGGGRGRWPPGHIPQCVTVRFVTSSMQMTHWKEDSLIELSGLVSALTKSLPIVVKSSSSVSAEGLASSFSLSDVPKTSCRDGAVFEGRRLVDVVGLAFAALLVLARLVDGPVSARDAAAVRFLAAGMASKSRRLVSESSSLLMPRGCAEADAGCETSVTGWDASARSGRNTSGDRGFWGRSEGELKSPVKRACRKSSLVGSRCGGVTGLWSGNVQPQAAS